MKPEIFTSRQALVNLYNKRMKLDLRPDDVDFSTPIRANAGQPYNTLVTISPKTHVMAIGNCKVAYNRIHVSRLGVISVDRGGAVTMHDLLQKIQDKYDLVFTHEDVEDTVIDPLLQGIIALDIQIKPTSVMYYAGAEIFTPTYPTPVAPSVWESIAPAGTVISEYCYGENRMVSKHDGQGGFYTELVLENSPLCGFDADKIYIFIDGSNADTVFTIEDQIGGGGAEVPI